MLQRSHSPLGHVLSLAAFASLASVLEFDFFQSDHGHLLLIHRDDVDCRGGVRLHFDGRKNHLRHHSGGRHHDYYGRDYFHYSHHHQTITESSFWYWEVSAVVGFSCSARDSIAVITRIPCRKGFYKSCHRTC